MPTLALGLEKASAAAVTEDGVMVTMPAVVLFTVKLIVVAALKESQPPQPGVLA
jgi:hypothetical protein